VAVRIPQYQNYVARAQAAEGFSLAGGLKTAIAEYHNITGVFPTGTTDARTQLGIERAEDITGNNVESVTVSDDGLGTITATFGSGNHAGKLLRLTLEPTGGAVFFNCTTTTKGNGHAAYQNGNVFAQTPTSFTLTCNASGFTDCERAEIWCPERAGTTCTGCPSTVTMHCPVGGAVCTGGGATIVTP